jgi:hypothetical protein
MSAISNEGLACSRGLSPLIGFVLRGAALRYIAQISNPTCFSGYDFSCDDKMLLNENFLDKAFNLWNFQRGLKEYRGKVIHKVREMRNRDVVFASPFVDFFFC